MKIRKDDRGLYITGRDGKDHYRPGDINGYSHVHDMSDGGLKAGDNPRTRHVSGAPLIMITLPSGDFVWWASTYMHDEEKKWGV